MFCLHTAITHDEYDPLDVSQWQFYVAGREAVASRAGASMGLITLVKIAGDPVPMSTLQNAIALAGEPSRIARSGRSVHT